MKLHTKDQAPREGQQPAETPFTAWEPGRKDYIRFLVDSLLVYETMDKIVAQHVVLQPFRKTGLERAEAIKEDLKWLCSFDKSLSIPPAGESGLKYAAFLEKIAAEVCSSLPPFSSNRTTNFASHTPLFNPTPSLQSVPKFMCHYYNHYFAHTAGGRMIGKKMADKLLDGTTLKFYQWEGDVRALLDETRKSMDALASTWSESEKQACLEETMACFRYGGSLMVYMKAPQP